MFSRDSRRQIPMQEGQRGNQLTLRFGWSLYGRLLAIREKALGPEHLDVAICLKNYANLLRNMNRSQQAEPLEIRARAIRAKSD
jgi:hypothetical protein